jgi:hypothetical protein
MIFPKSKGGLWAHNKTSEKQPDLKGHVEISKDVLRMLVNQAKAGVSDIKLQVAGWDRTARNSGQRYIYLTSEAYVQKEWQDRVLEVSGGAEPDPAPAVDYVKKDPWA